MACLQDSQDGPTVRLPAGFEKMVPNPAFLKTEEKKKIKKKSCNSATFSGNTKLEMVKRRQYDIAISNMAEWDCRAFLELGNEKISC